MIEQYELKARFSLLKPYCHLSGPDSFMELVEWKNGEGFDACIDEKQRISLTWGQMEALEVLTKCK